MPKYNDFKVGDVWIGKEGAEYEILEVNPGTREALVKIGTRGYWCTTEHRLVEWGYRLSNLGLTHKKLDTSKPVRRIDGGNECYTVVGKTTRGDLIVEAGNGCIQVYPAERLENAEKRKKTVDLVLLDVGGKLHITSSECADQVGIKLLGRNTVAIEEGEGL